MKIIWWLDWQLRIQSEELLSAQVRGCFAGAVGKMPAAFQMGSVTTSRQGVPPGTESPQLISSIQDASRSGGRRGGELIPGGDNGCGVELISCLVCLSLGGTDAALLSVRSSRAAKGAALHNLQLEPCQLLSFPSCGNEQVVLY